MIDNNKERGISHFEIRQMAHRILANLHEERNIYSPYPGIAIAAYDWHISIHSLLLLFPLNTFSSFVTILYQFSLKVCVLFNHRERFSLIQFLFTFRLFTPFHLYTHKLSFTSPAPGTSLKNTDYDNYV